MKKGYVIDFVANTVTITKGFAQKANDMNSAEFETLMKLREMGLRIVNAPAKAKPRRRNMITYDMMIHHMNNMAEAEGYLEEFDAVRDESKNHPNRYQYVRNWFDTRFPNYSAVPQFDKNLKIVNIPVNYETRQSA